ncbi:MAG: ABC transporter permease, partial [Thermoanaerobaculia bacterium]
EQPDEHRHLADVEADLGAGVSLLTVVIFGLAPALQGSKADLNSTLKEGGKRAAGNLKGRRLRSFLVISEVTLALVLLVGAGLMIQSVIQLQRIDPGFNPENVLTLRVRLPENKYPQVHQRQAFFDRLLERVQGLPGVTNAATVLQRPLEDSIGWDMPYAIEGQSFADLFKNPYANLEAVTPGYFQTMKIPLTYGRDFTPADDENGQLVAILGQSLAEKFFPGENPVGKRIRRVIGNEKTPWMTIVGVAEDVRYRGWNTVTLDFYVPADQNPFAEYIPYQDLVIRTQGDPLALAKAVRAEVYALDPAQSVAAVTTLQALVDRALAGPRFTMLLMGIFGALAVTLAAVGLYGVLSYTVNQRSREIAIRVALGARKQEVLRMVVAQGMKLTLIGVAAGVVTSFLLTRFMSTLLYGVTALDPVTFFLVPLLLVAIALLATFLPAWRATRANPVSVLRYD